MTGVTGNPEVTKLLENHPQFSEVIFDPKQTGCRFGSSPSWREIVSGLADAEYYGLIELIDNNPLVCAGAYSIPSLAVSLACVCLGPLTLSGVVTEPPAIICNVPIDEMELTGALGKLGWTEGQMMRHEEAGASPNLILASASAVVEGLSDLEDLKDLYLERFTRSELICGPFERLSPELVATGYRCAYQISLTPGEELHLVTARAIVPNDNRFHAAQIVQGINIMCGFEDGTGIPLGQI